MTLAALLVASVGVLRGGAWGFGTAALAGSLAILGPIGAVLAGALMVLGAALRRIRADLRRDRDDDVERVLAVAAIAVGAGVPFRVAIVEAAGMASTSVAADIHRSLRTLERGNLPASGHPDIRATFEAHTVASMTGTPLAPRLESLVQRHRAEAAALMSERQAKLPVKLLFPLALLILPGFLLLVVVPALAGTLGGLTL